MSLSPANTASSPESSPSNSQTRSMSHQDVTLDTLVSHLLASKRSLSSIHTVWRANEIVTSARSAFEESVVLNARAGFLRSGINEQIKILRRARGGVEIVYKEGQRDFKVCSNVSKCGRSANRVNLRPSSRLWTQQIRDLNRQWIYCDLPW